MHYHLCDSLYLTFFREEAILLDTKKDRYSILSKTFALLLNKAISNDAWPADHFLSNESSQLKKLVNDNILVPNEFPYPFYIDNKIDSSGVSNVDWNLPLDKKQTSLDLQVSEALLTLTKVNFYIKRRGFHKTILLIKKSWEKHLSYTFPEEEELNDLGNSLNKACLIYPTRTKCLEWAITFVLLSLKRQWRCNLEIGVQNYPFFAHAWVECGGKVVMDSQELREGLGIILNEPFRRINK